MPIPFIIGAVAVIAGATGVGSGIHGGVKMKEANDTMKLAESIQRNAVERFNKKNKSTTELMDSIGTQELNILKSFDEFSDLMEKIQNKPDFKKINRSGVTLPHYTPEDLKDVSVGAGVLLGGIGGAGAGAAGGFAAAGATTSAVMALGTASTGTAISSLSGVAATNATLAALGGGSLAAGGGGMALGTAVLGGATLGIGLLVGGIIFNATGSHLSDQADKAYSQARDTERKVNSIVSYLEELSSAGRNFQSVLTKVNENYTQRLGILDNIVNFSEKTDWNDFSEKEKMLTQNLVLLVGMLYQMCKVQMVLKTDDQNGINKVNHAAIDRAITDSNRVLDTLAA